jgi:hypothetical protein
MGNSENKNDLNKIFEMFQKDSDFHNSSIIDDYLFLHELENFTFLMLSESFLQFFIDHRTIFLVIIYVFKKFKK